MNDVIDFERLKTDKALSGIKPISSETLGLNNSEPPMPDENQNYDGYVYSVSQFEAQYGIKVVDEEDPDDFLVRRKREQEELFENLELSDELKELLDKFEEDDRRAAREEREALYQKWSQKTDCIPVDLEKLTQRLETAKRREASRLEDSS